jgi:saccharopine dehydrogenase-like NADP-dependent oxidoreductase
MKNKNIKFWQFLAVYIDNKQEKKLFSFLVANAAGLKINMSVLEMSLQTGLHYKTTAKYVQKFIKKRILRKIANKEYEIAEVLLYEFPLDKLFI